jgi:formylglycine-generating enzyme
MGKEYACRAGTTTRFNTGDSITTSQANYYGDEFYKAEAFKKTTMPVGSFAPNDWDLYDMHGNVFEWYWDWRGDYPSEAQTDPVGAVSGYERISRGGSMISVTENVRSANRMIGRPSCRVYDMGFRVVRNDQ